LYTFFFIIGLLCYLKYFDSKQNRLLYYSFTLLFFIISCLSKGMAVVFPMILVIIDFKKGVKINLKNQLNKIPFFLIAIVFGIIAIKAQATDKGIYDTSAFSVLDKICLPAYGFLFYLVKMVYPADLSIIYPYPVKTSSLLPIDYLISPFIFVLLVILVLYSLKYNRKIAFGSLFFFFCILPVLQIIPVGISIASDRYFYLSSIGLFFITGLGLDYLIQKSGKTIKFLSYFFIIFTAIVLINLTRSRTKVWKNTLTLWQDVIRHNPKIDKSYFNIGLQLDRYGNMDSAISYYKKAIYYNPRNVKALNNLGNRMYDKRKYDSAHYYYKMLVAADSLYYPVYHNMGNIYYIKGNLDTAILYYNKALSLKNDFALSHFTLGNCWNQKGDTIKSKAFYIKAAQLGNTDAQSILKSKNIKW
jgi:tetratricopeptide (TPR) repeat protein